MKRIISSVLFVAAVFAYTSCSDESDEPSSKKGIQGFWETKTSATVVTLLDIDDTTISTYQISYDPAFMSAAKEWNNYFYNPNTGKITVYIQNVPFDGQVQELSSTTLTWKADSETETYKRVSYSGDYAPTSLTGKTIGVGSYNFQMEANGSANIIFFPITAEYSTLMDSPTYSYVKTGANAATVTFKFGEKVQVSYDSYADYDVIGTLELVFDTPNVGYVKSGSFVYNGNDYELVNSNWELKDPDKMTMDYSFNYFVLK